MPQQTVSTRRERRVSNPAHEERHRATARFNLLRLLTYLLVYGVGLLMLGPFLWMIFTAVKPTPEIVAIPIRWLPSHLTLEHFSRIFQFAPFGRYLLNSFGVTLICTICDILVASVVGYGFAKFKFSGATVIFVTMLTGLMVPFSVRMLPVYRLIAALHLADTYAGLIVPNVTSILAIFLMRQFLVSFPTEVLESGRLDGASEIRIFASLVFPNTKPILSAIGIFKFVYYWNDFLWPLVVINSPSKRTIPVGIAMFVGRQYLEYGPFMAAASISILPILVVTMVLQRYFVRGVMMTGLKG